MVGTRTHNRGVLNKGFKEFEERILNKATETLSQWCRDILDDAIKYRESNPMAHNFTGNLLNSIVACLYRERKPVVAYFSSSMVTAALYPKMSARSSRRYVFNPDYDGKSNSKYLPTIKTNRGWGKDDAEKFFNRYKPRGANLFDIVVAYTVEYADFIEQQRGTSGILQTYSDAKHMGMTLLKVV